MDLRKKVKVNPHHIISIPLGEAYEVDEGDKVKLEYENVSSISLADLIAKVKEENISESDFSQVKCSIGYYPGSHDTFFVVEFLKPKTQKEIDTEIAKAKKAMEDQKQQKIQKQKEREKNEQIKKKVIETLTAEQKKALGIK